MEPFKPKTDLARELWGIRQAAHEEGEIEPMAYDDTTAALVDELAQHGMPEDVERHINYNAVDALMREFTPAQARAIAFAILTMLTEDRP